MKHKFGKQVIIGLGGSIVCPDGVNVAFLNNFQKFIRSFIRSGRKVVIVIGGGGVAREYQKAAASLTKVTNEDKDWLGIHATRLNAHLMRTVFRDISDPVVMDNHKKIKKLEYKLTVASGWTPGWSTDYVAFAIADKLKIPEVIVAGKPDYVYESDPTANPKAKKFESISWKDYRALVPEEWNPGMHAPVDPVATRLAAKRKIKAIVVDGRNLNNFRRLLSGKKFRGTIVG